MICIAQPIPGTASPLRHGVSLSLGRTIAIRTLNFYPTFNRGQGRFACSCGFIIFHFRQSYRQIFFRHWLDATVLAMNNRDWFAPISLPGKHPVTKLILDFWFAKFFNRFSDRNKRFVYYWKFKFFSELPISFVVRRHSHDSAGAITHKHIVRNPDRNFFFSRWVLSFNPNELNS